MKLRDVNLSTRITLAALLLVIAGGIFWVLTQNQRLHDAYLNERHADLEVALHIEKLRLSKTIAMLRQDAIFLATPLQHLDPQNLRSDAIRLQNLFAAFLQAHPDYSQARVIVVANGGQEWVRVDNDPGHIRVTGDNALQAKGDRDYFKAGLLLTQGQVHLSEFTLEQEWGTILVPHRPLLRAVTPVFDANGQLFGMVVLSLDVQPLLSTSFARLPSGVQGYVANQQGHYLSHPDARQEFAFEQGHPPKISDDFPLLNQFIATQKPSYLTLQAVDGGRGGYLAAEPVFFDPSHPTRFLLLAYHIPAEVAAKQLSFITTPNLTSATLVIILLSAAFMLILRHAFAPLKRITLAARKIAAGEQQIRLTETGGDEIGEVSASLNAMLDKLSDREVVQRERDFRNSIVATTHDGYWLIDANGFILEANQAYADLSGYTITELLGMHISQLESIEQSAEAVRVHIAKIMSLGYDVFETRHRHKSGHEIDLEISSTLMREYQQFVVFIRDIRERKQADKELRIAATAFESHEGMVVTDENNVILRINQAFTDITGYTAAEAVGQKMRFLKSDRQDADFYNALWEAVLHNGKWQGEIWNRNKKGEERSHWLSISAVKDKNLVVTNFVGAYTDITDLKHHQNLLNEAQLLGRIGSWELNLDSSTLHWSDEIYRIFELDPAQFQPSYENFLNAIHPDDRHAVDQAYTHSLQNRQPYDVTHRLLLGDGRIKWVREHCRSDFDASGKPLRSVGAVQDITEQKKVEEWLRVAAVAFETHEAIVITNPEGNIIRVNQAFQDITGYSEAEVLGQNPSLLSSGRQDKAFYDDMWRQLVNSGTWTGEIWDKRKNGQIYPKWLTITAAKNDAGKTTEYVAIFSDITARKQAEDEIRNLAFYDALTTLPNRRLLMERLHTALSASARSHKHGAVLFLDMDKFKNLNDTLGHDYGDLLLIEVAERLQSCVRESDTVARLGGDEFVVILAEIEGSDKETSQKVALVADKIREALSIPYKLKESTYHSSPSIGVSLYCGNEESVDNILKHADMAMYQAKEAGRNTVIFFDPAMQRVVETHAKIESALRHAIANQQLCLHYQIQVDQAHHPLGAEALLRWTHPQLGKISPAQFIPIAEENTLIFEIGDWVLNTACQQLHSWKSCEKTRHLILAVNVSGLQFRQANFVHKIKTLLRQYDIDPAYLKLELTESVVLNNVAEVVSKMHALKALGIRLSMDDFGTGYSSLSYLKNLPLDQIKIDQSFVRDLTTDANDAMMIRTIIDIGKNFQLNIIAEGVETIEQLNFLKMCGCMAFQGYYFSQPVEIGAFMQLLEQRRFAIALQQQTTRHFDI